jgi:hypothetical protein
MKTSNMNRLRIGVLSQDRQIALKAGLVAQLVRRPEGEDIARYPRVRFVDRDAYGGNLGESLAGVNAAATLQTGLGAPAIAHLRVV